MACYAINYLVALDEDYDMRRDSIVREIARFPHRWAHPGFALIETEANAIDLERALYYGSELESVKDRLIVISLGEGGAAARGRFPDPDGMRAMIPDLLIV